MVWFNIISLENFDSIFGPFKKGDIIETIEQENEFECRQYVFDKYGPMGENIKVKIKEVLY